MPLTKKRSVSILKVQTPERFRSYMLLISFLVLLTGAPAGAHPDRRDLYFFLFMARQDREQIDISVVKHDSEMFNLPEAARAGEGKGPPPTERPAGAFFCSRLGIASKRGFAVSALASSALDRKAGRRYIDGIGQDRFHLRLVLNSFRFLLLHTWGPRRRAAFQGLVFFSQ